MAPNTTEGPHKTPHSGANPPESLALRFQRFLRLHPGAELIDELPKSDPAAQQSGERADFLLERRCVFGEIKSLETDTRYKIEEIVTLLRSRAEWPEFYGSWSLKNVMQNLSDGPEVLRRIGKALTSAVPGLVRKANRQIAASKSAIGKTSGDGLLVILNDGIEVLAPYAVTGLIRQELLRKRVAGKPAFPHIQLVLVASEAHRVVPGGDARGLQTLLPLISTENEAAPPTETGRRAMQLLLEGWARFNSAPLLVSKGEMPPIIGASEAVAANSPTTRSDAWRREYRLNRTLGNLSFEELVGHGSMTMVKLTPHFLKGGEKLSPEVVLHLMRRFTEFEEEMNFRAIPASRWGPLVTAGSREKDTGKPPATKERPK